VSPSVKLPLALSFLLVAACLLGAAPAAAQGQAAPVLGISPGTAALTFHGNDTAPQFVAFTVSNTGPTSATVTVALQVPAGWQAEVTPSSFTLAAQTPTQAGGSSGVTVTVVPILGKVRDGTLTLTATGTGQAPSPVPGQTSTATATVALGYVPPPPPPAPYDYRPLYLSIVGAVLLALVALYLFLGSQVRLKLSATEVAEFPGNRGTVMLLIENRARRARKIQLRLRGLSQPWSGALMVPHVLLDAGASTEIPISVSIPRDAPLGTLRAFKVQAKVSGPFFWMGTRRVAARVVA
jgi:hypothetical protein